MRSRNQKLTTAVFAAFILLGGVIHYSAVWLHPYYDMPWRSMVETLQFCIIYCLYAGLVLFWVQSVYRRLLPSPGRQYIAASGLLMIVHLLITVIKYRIVMSVFQVRISWYASYIPLILIPTLFLLCCLSLTGRRGILPFSDEFILITAVLITAAVLTNDYHHLAFRPAMEGAAAWSDKDSYIHGILYYLACIWIGLTISGGVFSLLGFSARQKSWRAAAGPLIFLCLIPVLLKCMGIMKDRLQLALWTYPIICIFCFMGVFETCIRSRLIPYNDNYAGFFAHLDFPVIITDQNLNPVFRTSMHIEASGEQLAAALAGPVWPEAGLRLSGMRIAGGYAFWEEDERELHRLNEQLEEANETIGLENRLIQYENEQKEEQARIEARTAVYEKAAAGIYPVQKRLEKLLENAVPGEDSLRETIAKVSILNAYVKRKSNFILSYSEKDSIPARELLLAIDEVVRFMGYCGVTGSAECLTDQEFSYRMALDLYDSFEMLTEEMMPHITKMMAVLVGDSLRLTMNPSGSWKISALPLAAVSSQEEGLLYVTISTEEGEDR